MNTLIANPPPGAPVPPILPPKDGYLFLDKTKFCSLVRGRRGRAYRRLYGEFASSVGLGRAERPDYRSGLRTKPSWYLLVTDDRMIPLPAQRFMCERAGATASEVPGSHAIYVSNPSAVANLIETAANSPKLAR